MTEATLFRPLLVGWIALAGVVFLLLLFVSAPYGRHRRTGWGPSISARAGWLLMELPSAVLLALMFLAGGRRDAASFAFLLLWEVHYLHRALVFPLRRRGGGRMPLAVALMAVAFNGVNAYLNGRWLFALGPVRDASWLADPRFLAGAVLFAVGFAVNLEADARLRRLRAPGETGYRIPRGGLFRWVSCPNYLGEIVEWCGWALATWSLAGLSFAAWTVANLVPRALSHHRWYRATFPEYPRERRALLPFVF